MSINSTLNRMNKGMHTIHNIGIIAHIDAGKTTTTERLLYITGLSHKLGEVDEGTAAMDWMEQEQERGITISSSATTVAWKEHTINIIDTPGHVDFTIEVERSLRVLDGAVGIFCAVGGVEPQSETVWKQSKHYNVGKIAYINKMDRMGAHFEKTLADIAGKLKVRPLPLTLPIGKEKTFEGIIDLLRMKELHWDAEKNGLLFTEKPIRDEMLNAAREARNRIVDVASEYCDTIAEKYLADEAITNEQLLAALKQGVLDHSILPVFCGASLKNIGIQTLLDGIITLLPRPEDMPPLVVHDFKDTKKTMTWTHNTKTLALVFKSMIDKHFGLMHFVRVYSGSIKTASSICNTTTGERERINRVLKMHANKSTQVEALHAGEIGVLIGPKNVRTGHTIAEDLKPRVLLEYIPVPEPVISATMEAHNISERDALLDILLKLTVEDPSLRYGEDESTGQVVISGMGELHLDVVATRIQTEYNIPSRLGHPQVKYRESVSATHRDTFVIPPMLMARLPARLPIKLGHHPQEKYFESITLEVSAGDANTGIVFHSLLKAEKKETAKHLAISFIEKGVREASLAGIALGYPCVDMHITLRDIAYDFGAAPVPDELFCTYAASRAFQHVAHGAKPVKMEPIMKVVIASPQECVGGALGTITQRMGIVHEVIEEQTQSIIHAQAPLRTLFGYATSIRSATQGRASFTMEFDCYKATRNVE